MNQRTNIFLMATLYCVVGIALAGDQTAARRDGGYILSSQASMEKDKQLFCPTPKVYVAIRGVCSFASNEVKQDEPPILAQAVLDKVFGSGLVKLSKVVPLEFDPSVSKLYYRLSHDLPRTPQ